MLLGAIAIGLSLIYYTSLWLLKLWAKAQYEYWLQNPLTKLNLDAFINGPINHLKVVLITKFQLGSRQARSEAIPLECVRSPHVKGLWVSQKKGTSKGATLLSELKEPIVVATIRMGFGHHRLAYSATSWALETGRPTIFHDLLNIESEEADLIKSSDELYSRFSRYASEMGGWVERAWGALMKSGDADALRVAALTAAQLQPLLKAYPLDTPLVTTHQLVALTASALGFKRVVNLVVDNHPQWFLLAPQTLNIVQGPVNYQSFLKFGVSPSQLRWAGHWCPASMIQNLKQDCERRLQRLKKPLRLLIPVGGAGAQRKFIVAFIEAVADYVKEGKVQLLLNAGDHKHMKEAFLQALDHSKLSFDQVTTTKGVMDVQAHLLGGREPASAVTLFSFDEYFPAVATTDIMARVADVLVCKPSELAFYAVPKLHIRRVGDHEADSACRASELGDGTTEARTIDDAMKFIQLFLQDDALLTSMNQAIMRNNEIGLYDGCRMAIEYATRK